MPMWLRMYLYMHACMHVSAYASSQVLSPCVATPNTSNFEALEGSKKRENACMHMPLNNRVLHHIRSTADEQPYTRTSTLEGCCTHEDSGIQWTFAFFVSLSMPLSTRLLPTLKCATSICVIVRVCGRFSLVETRFTSASLLLRYLLPSRAAVLCHICTC